MAGTSKNGQRLAGFCEASGVPANTMRTLIARDQVPFDCQPVEGERRLYTGGDALAMAAASLMVRVEKVSWAIAADRVRSSGAVREYLQKMRGGEAAKEVWLVTCAEWDFEPFKTLITGTYTVFGDEQMWLFLQRPNAVSFSFMRMQDAFEEAVETAKQNGWILSAGYLFKAESAA